MGSERRRRGRAPDWDRNTVATTGRGGPETATLFVPQSYVEPKPCCPDFPKRTPLFKKFVEYTCFLVFGCGCQLLTLYLTEDKEFNSALGEGFYLVESYFKLAGAATSFIAALFGCLGIRFRSMRGLVGLVIVLCLNIVFAVLTEVLTRSYSVDGTIQVYLQEYMKNSHRHHDEAGGTEHESEMILNHIQHEFSCCGGKHGVKDYGKNVDILPGSCCFIPEQEVLIHKDQADVFCNLSTHFDAIHPMTCIDVTGRYLRHVLLSSEVTEFYTVIASLLCLLFATLYGFEIYKEDKQASLLKQFNEPEEESVAGS